MLRATHQRDSNFVCRSVAGHHVLVPATGDLPPDTFLLLLDGPVALFLWEALEAPRSKASLTELVITEFSVERGRAGADVEGFLAQLRAAGCLRPAPPA